MTIKEALLTARQILKSPSSCCSKDSIVEDTRLLLLSSTRRFQLQDIFISPDAPLEAEEEKKFFENIERRSSGLCVSAITGCKSFYSFSFFTGENVLIPRPETEMIVEKALDFIDKYHSTRLLDICTGTGCIALSIAKSSPIPLDVSMGDISDYALAIAQKNANNLNIDAKIIKSDLFSAFRTEKFDIITANPPYISQSEYQSLSSEVKREPYIALVSDNEGLMHIKKIIDGAKGMLAYPSALFIEIGESQGDEVFKYAKSHFPDAKCEISKDLNGKDRVLSIFNTP